MTQGLAEHGQDLHNFILDAYQHEDDLGAVQDKLYTLLSEEFEIIRPTVWEACLQPGARISMSMNQSSGGFAHNSPAYEPHSPGYSPASPPYAPEPPPLVRPTQPLFGAQASKWKPQGNNASTVPARGTTSLFGGNSLFGANNGRGSDQAGEARHVLGESTFRFGNWVPPATGFALDDNNDEDEDDDDGASIGSDEEDGLRVVDFRAEAQRDSVPVDELLRQFTNAPAVSKRPAEKEQ